jgi:hypothetical protein
VGQVEHGQALHGSDPELAVGRAGHVGSADAALCRSHAISLAKSPLGLPVLRMVHFAYMPSPNTPAGLMKFVRSYDSISFGLPRNRGGSAPALVFSRPAQRLLALRPACSPSRQCDLLHRRLQQLRCLRRCFDCYRVERTSSRAGLTPAVDHHLSRRTRFRDLPGLSRLKRPERADESPRALRTTRL